jgi:glucose/arabinose dehydrogenase
MFLSVCATPAHASDSTTVAQTEQYRVRIRSVASGLAHPWSLAFLPDGRMLVTERAGRLRMIDANGRLDPAPVSGLPRVDAQGQGGLLDVVPHPQFAVNRLIYWSYVQRDALGRNGTEVARGVLGGTPGAYRVEQVKVLFQLRPKSYAGVHFGSRLAFDAQGRLYVGLGDRGDKDRAQDPADAAGKILRFTDDGKPVGAGLAGALPEVFSLGHRNVQGLAIDAKGGAVWATEHGPQGGDELNRIASGLNYGWPVITYGVNYGIGTRIGEGTEKAGLQQPVRHWVPSPALSGLAIYDGNRFPAWRGNLLLGALRGQTLIRVRLEGERAVAEEFMLQGTLPRVRDVRVGPDGFVYLLTDEPNGSVLRLEPAS